MPQDAYTLRYLCQELNQTFSGGKINRIVQPNGDQVIFTVYTGKRTEKLFIDVNPSMPRIGVLEEEKDSPLTAPNFCMLLRKHLLSATVDGISLVGFDRIVKIDLSPSTEFFDAEKKVLYVELMGRYSNVILTENGKILGGNRGINYLDNGVRPLIVGKDYVFPPVGEKKLPTDESLIDVIDGEKLAESICANVQGIATSTAREIANEYFELNTGFDKRAFFEFFNGFLFRKEYSPVVCIDDKGIKDVLAFPYKTVGGEYKNFESLIGAEEFYFTQREKLKEFTSLKERLFSVVTTCHKKAGKRLSAIAQREKDALSADDNKIKGELILANIYKLKGGENCLETENYYDGSIVKITLDPYLSPSDNAERYYKKYNKQKRTLSALAPQKENAQKELDYLVSVMDFISLAEDLDDLICVKEELLQAGLLTEKVKMRKKNKETANCRLYKIDGFTVRAGRNNTENDKIAFSASANDVWLHSKDYHSSHVVIESAGKTIPEKVIIKSAQICAYYSKGRNGGKTDIVYTLRKNLKKPPKSKPGFCTYTDFKSVTVQPCDGKEFAVTV